MSAAEILAKPLCTLAFCWRIERRDGVTIGLTSHDRDLSIDGMLYQAMPGVSPSAIAGDTSLDGAGMDLKGAISSSLIGETDLEAGRWDGAAMRLYLTEWDAPGALWLPMARGELGAVERQGDSYSAEMRGPVSVLDLAIAPETSPDCRAMLGDRDCRVDMALRRRWVRVESVDGAEIAVAGGGFEDGDYAYGLLRWMSGANCGIEQSVVASDVDGVTLTEAPPFTVEVGALALLTQGCDKRLETCSARFGNAVNFRGEPYLPGNDLLTRYPGA